MPQISVIVPVYKVEPYLHRCVDSILNQTFKDFELILVDDGSPDGCPAICDAYAKQDTRVHVIHQPNGGLSAARNAGIDWTFANSDSEWITFVDSDDWIHLEMLGILYGAVHQHQVSISMCNLEQVSSIRRDEPSAYNIEISKKYVTEKEMEYLFYGQGHGGYACGKLISKSILKDNKFTPGRIYEDSAVTCRWFYQAGEFAECSISLYYYYVNPEGIMRSKFSLNQLDILWSKEQQERFYESIGYYYMQSVVIDSYLLSAARCYQATAKELRDRKTARIVKKSMISKYWNKKSMIKLEKRQKLYIAEMLYPKTMAIYWLVYGVTHRNKDCT